MHSKEINQVLREEFNVHKINNIRSVSGGCINNAYHYDTDACHFFIKTNTVSHSKKMFDAEYKGLEVLANACNSEYLHVPKPLYVGDLSNGAFIVLEYMEMSSGRSTEKTEELFAHGLADLHSYDMNSNTFGFQIDNYIGDTPQPNTTECESWIEFFTRYRIQYMCDLIIKKHHDREIQRTLDESGLLTQMNKLFPNGMEHKIKPSIIHGDLWSGNYSVNRETGKPIIFDPAVYKAHSEAELGIMHMFGGYSSHFFELYDKYKPPIEQQGKKQRLKLYQLYHYMNHYVIFGSGYSSQCFSLINNLAEYTL
jgi:protein-ribulosamine 3-kinase